MKLTKMEQLREGMNVRSSDFNRLGELKEGKLHKEKYNWFVCSNEYNGSDCENKLGYECSWVFDNEAKLAQLNLETVEPQQLRDCVAGDILSVSDGKVKVLFANENIAIISTFNNFETASSKIMTWEQLELSRYTPYIEPEPEPEPIKMTVAECAAKMGIDPKQLHIIDK